MGKLKRNVAELYDLDGDWEEMIFTCHNPTNSDVFFDLFNPLIPQTYNVPNTPFGYIQPPVLQGLGSGSPAPPTPTALSYPTIPTVDTYARARNNTMVYDSNHGRMYMTYTPPPSTLWYLTWKDSVDSFTTFSILLTSINPIVVIDTAVSTTSDKLYVLTIAGECHIFDTITNTLITVLVLPTLGSSHNRIEWNSVKDSFYVTVGVGSHLILEIDASTDTVSASIPAPAGSNPFGITFKSSTNEMFVTYNLTDAIAKISCATNTLTTIIAASITSSPTAILYNPITDLVTYGSQTTLGVRTFNATTLVFESAVISVSALDISLYPLDNKIYILEYLALNVTIIDGSSLVVLNNISTVVSVGDRAEISFFPPDDEMYVNFNVTYALMLVGRLQKANSVFYIDGSTQYNVAIRDFLNSPAWIRRIYVYSRNENNFKQVINHIYKDANGIEVQVPLIPSLSVGINQFQGWMAELDFKDQEVVFGINQWFKNVFVEKNSDLTMLVIYQQIDKSKLLAIGSALYEKTIGDEMASCPNTVRKWSEKDLALYDTALISPYKQNMFLGQKQDAVVPFNFSYWRKLELELEKSVEKNIKT